MLTCEPKTEAFAEALDTFCTTAGPLTDKAAVNNAWDQLKAFNSQVITWESWQQGLFMLQPADDRKAHLVAGLAVLLGEKPCWVAGAKELLSSVATLTQRGTDIAPCSRAAVASTLMSIFCSSGRLLDAFLEVPGLLPANAAAAATADIPAVSNWEGAVSDLLPQVVSAWVDSRGDAALASLDQEMGVGLSSILKVDKEIKRKVCSQAPLALQAAAIPSFPSHIQSACWQMVGLHDMC